MEVKVHACFKLNVINPSWRNKVCEAVVVRSCTYFLVPVLHAGYLRFYKALSQLVQFVGDRVRLLECSPASCLALRNHREETRETFFTRKINNKSPSHFSSDTGTRHISFLFGWMKNSFIGGKTSLFERNTILSHLPGTLPVTCLKRKSTCPGRPDGGFFEPWTDLSGRTF